MSQLERLRTQTLPAATAAQRVSPARRGLMRHVSRELATLEAQTLVRMANVQAHGIVAKEKMVEIDHLAREAMTGQAMLVNWAGALAHDNAVLYEELRFFVGVARMGKSQIIADLVDTFCREGR